jgi:O-antigen ligase
MQSVITAFNYLFAFSMPFSHIGGYAASGIVFLLSWHYWKNFRRDPLFFWLRILMIYGFLRAALSPQTNVGFSVMLGYLSHWVLPFILGYGLAELQTVKKSFWTYYITFISLIFLSVLAFFGYFKPVFFGDFQLAYEGLLKGGRSHIALGAICTILSFFSIGQILYNDKLSRNLKISLSAGLVFLSGALFLTGSRGYYLTALAVFALCSVVLVFHEKIINKRWLFAGLIGVSIAVAGLYLVSPTIQFRIKNTSGIGKGSIFQRIDLYRIALWEIKDKPLFGFGPGQGAVHKEEYFERLPDKGLLLKGFQHLHNFCLNFGADFGLVGLVLFLLLAVSWLKNIWKIFINSTGFVKAFSFGLFWAVISILLGDCLDTLLRGPGVAMELFWLTGMLFSISKEGEKL